MPNNRKVPNSAAIVKEKDKNPVAANIDFSGTFPCWRFSNFDKDGPWGLNSLLKFTFHYNQTIYEKVFNSGIQNLDTAFEDMDGKVFDNRTIFWNKIKNTAGCDIPVELINELEKEIVSNVFIEKIYPKLTSLESITWDEIRLQSHSGKGKMKSNNHEIEVGKLGQEALKRLKELKFDDRDKIYSLRLEGTLRIYGFREMNFLDIIWVDLNHEVYPINR